jgi:hypothetical protein
MSVFGLEISGRAGKGYLDQFYCIKTEDHWTNVAFKVISFCLAIKRIWIDLSSVGYLACKALKERCIDVASTKKAEVLVTPVVEADNGPGEGGDQVLVRAVAATVAPPIVAPIIAARSQESVMEFLRDRMKDVDIALQTICVNGSIQGMELRLKPYESNPEYPLLRFFHSQVSLGLKPSRTREFVAQIGSDKEKAVVLLEAQLGPKGGSLGLKSLWIDSFRERCERLSPDAEEIEGKLACEVLFFLDVYDVIQSVLPQERCEAIQLALRDLLTYGHRELRLSLFSLFIHQAYVFDDGTIMKMTSEGLGTKHKRILSRVILEALRREGYDDDTLQRLAGLIETRAMRDIGKQGRVWSGLLFLYAHSRSLSTKKELLDEIVQESFSIDDIIEKLENLRWMEQFDHSCIIDITKSGFDLIRFLEKKIIKYLGVSFRDETERAFFLQGFKRNILDSRDPHKILYFFSAMHNRDILAHRVNQDAGFDRVYQERTSGLFRAVCLGEFTQWRRCNPFLKAHYQEIEGEETINLALFIFQDSVKSHKDAICASDPELYGQLLRVSTFEEARALANARLDIFPIKSIIEKCTQNRWDRYTLEESEKFVDFVLQGVEVAGSCLSFTSQHNIDGRIYDIIDRLETHRLFLIRNDKGKIQSRICIPADGRDLFRVHWYGYELPGVKSDPFCPGEFSESLLRNFIRYRGEKRARVSLH